MNHKHNSSINLTEATKPNILDLTFTEIATFNWLEEIPGAALIAVEYHFSPAISPCDVRVKIWMIMCYFFSETVYEQLTLYCTITMAQRKTE